MKRVIPAICISASIWAQTQENPYNSPLVVLSTIEQTGTPVQSKNQFNPNWVDSLKLILPCENVPVPQRTKRLPNATREYRNGIHRGIDFFANWGSPVKAVADGIIVRADQNYKEFSTEFLETMLKESAQVGDTPTDIFNSVLLGQAVIIDHGFELVPGFRSITIYAHLSHINDEIYQGAYVKAGEQIGLSGNTGMKESTMGSKAGSHLHWEFILQQDKKEMYLGQGMPNPDLYHMLHRIFN